MKIIIPWLVALLALGGAVYFHNTASQTAQTVADLQQQLQALQGVQAENEQLKTNLVPADELAQLRQDSHEVLKLRNEVQILHAEQDKLTQVAEASQIKASQMEALAQIQTAQAQAAQAQAQAAQAQAAQTAQAAQATLVSAPPPPPVGAPPAPLSDQDLANQCINNLRQIDAAKNQWALETGKTTGAVPVEKDLAPYLKGNALPTCPGGGTYTINPIGQPPTCSIAGHVLP